MQVTTVGLDLAKTIFQVHGVTEGGEVAFNRPLRRAQVLAFFKRLSPCLIGIESCASSHHWARELSQLGHTVRLMPPMYVKPYVKRGKSDAIDAEAICEAVTRPTMRFVEIESEEQQALLSLHRARDFVVRQRNQLINMLRSLAAEFGIAIARGVARATLSKALDDQLRATAYLGVEHKTQDDRCQHRDKTRHGRGSPRHHDREHQSQGKYEAKRHDPVVAADLGAIATRDRADVERHGFDVHRDEERQVVEHGRQKRRVAECQAGNAGDIRHDEGNGPHYRRHELPPDEAAASMPPA